MSGEDLKGLQALADIWRQHVKEAIAAEREACAKIAESNEVCCDEHGGEFYIAEQIAAAIRARGKP